MFWLALMTSYTGYMFEYRNNMIFFTSIIDHFLLQLNFIEQKDSYSPSAQRPQGIFLFHKVELKWKGDQLCYLNYAI